MKPIRTSTTNCILVGQTEDVLALPVTRFELSNGITAKGISAVQSCWQLSREELKEVNETGKIYFSTYGNTHPPICLSCTSIIPKEVEDELV